MIRCPAALVFALLLSAAATTSADGDPLYRLRQTQIRAAATAAAESVVQIETLGGLERVGKLLVSNAPTTGVIVSTDGLIVSSAFNFIQKPNSILVTLPGGERKAATIVARDRSRMLVLLKVETDTVLSVPEIGKRTDWQVGQTVVAIGKTFDAEQPNLSVGILSALDRVWGKAIQTDAKISPANYGGPLIDLHGRHLGVLVPLSPDSDGELAGAEWYDSGIGFAVPLEDIMRQLPRWSTGEDLQPGKLGVSLKDPEDLDPEPVVGVVKLKSPAAEAGIRAGDRIVSVDGRATDRLSQMRHALTPRYAGDQVALVIRRDDEELNLNVTLVAKVPPYEHPFLGIIPDRQTGSDKAMVEFCYPDSPAELAGLKPGDQITHWNEQAIDSVAALRLAIANVEPGATVTVAWQREAEPISAQVKLAALPRTILATAPTHKDGEERPDFEVGELEVSVPEVPHAYKAYVPASMQKGHVPGLVVVLPPPGEGKSDDLIAAWKPVCEARDLVLLVAKPADDNRWTSREVDTVRKFIDQAKTRFGIDEQRIGLVGDGAGGAMAYLLTIRNRELIRGLAIRDAASPVPIEAFENEPLTRLAFLFLTHASLDNNSDMEKEMNELVAAKFPVTQRSLEDDSHKLVASDIEAIGLWLDCLDRL